MGAESNMSTNNTITEPGRDLSVYAECDVLVIGGGPAGCAAAASAAEAGANVILMERYGHLGGMSTGGFVLWIDRMTDWSGNHVISGFATELLDRLPSEGLLGPDPELWGSKDQALVDYWGDRSAAYQGVVTWSPTVDPELLKNVSIDVLEEKGVKLLMHSWGVQALVENDQVKGGIFESKSGRQAILAKVTIDATGDGDVFDFAGAEHVNDVVEDNIHHRMNVAFLWGDIDYNKWLDFKNNNPEDFRAVMAEGAKVNVVDRPHAMPRNDMALFMGPRLAGYSCIDVDDLSTVEAESRRRMMEMIDFYRKKLPGFENAYVHTTAPQMGTRHSRRLVGVSQMQRSDWTSGVRHDDEIGISPAPNARHPNVSVPYNSLVPIKVNGLLAAGRCLSTDPITHTFMREVPQSWLLGQGAGAAAAQAANKGIEVRDVNIQELQAELRRQGVILHDN